MLKPRKATWVFLVLLQLPGTLLADDGRKDHRRGPPPEAVEACDSVATGDACSFEGRRHLVEGICMTRHEMNVCVPEHHMRRFKEHSGRPGENEYRPDELPADAV